MKSFNVQNIDTEEINNVLLELKRVVTTQKSQNSASLVSLSSFVNVLQNCLNTLKSVDNNLQFYVDYFEGVLSNQSTPEPEEETEDEDEE